MGDKLFSSPKRPDRLCCPSRLLFNGFGREVKLHFHLLTRLRISAAVPILTICNFIFFYSDCNRFPPKTCFRYVQVLFKTGFAVFNTQKPRYFQFCHYVIIQQSELLAVRQLDSMVAAVTKTGGIHTSV
jgi:hypothetical protein